MPCLQFKHRCEETWLGTHVRVVGSCRSLGSWRPEVAVTLHTTAEQFPIWRSDVLELLDDEVRSIEYKYIICNEKGEAQRWEARENRVLCASIFKPYSTVIVSEPFDCCDLVENLRFSYRFSSMVFDIAPNPNPGSLMESKSLTFVDQRLTFAAPSPVETMEMNEVWSPTLRTPSWSQICNSRSAGNVGSFQSRSFTDMYWMYAGAACQFEHVQSQTLSEHDEKQDDEHEHEQDANPQELSPVSSETGIVETEECYTVREVSASNLNMQGGIVREESASKLCLNMHACESAEFQQRYRLEGQSPLAEGSFGLVWVCALRDGIDQAYRLGCPHAGSTQKRAAKIIHKSQLRPREFQLLLGEHGEIQTHLRLRHPHIVALFEAFDELRTVSLVMEYCRGGDLFDALASTRQATGLGLQEEDACVAQKHILLALAYLDSEHIAHRDIKCENVLLLHERHQVPISKNVLKLCDFGFATSDDGSGLKDRLGSPDTVAPEVIQGRPYGTKADVWSAGVVLFMMLSSRSPFWAPTDVGVLARVRNAEWSMTGEAWKNVSESAKACVSAMMVADPSQRPTAKEMLEQHAWLTADFHAKV